MTVAQAAELLDRLPPTMLLCVATPDDPSGVRAVTSLTTTKLVPRGEGGDKLALEVAVIA